MVNTACTWSKDRPVGRSLMKFITKNKLTRERRKGVKSKFKKYFDTLPEEFSVPLTMTEEEFQLLPRQLKRRADRERKRLKKRFDHLMFITHFNFEGDGFGFLEISDCCFVCCIQYATIHTI